MDTDDAAAMRAADETMLLMGEELQDRVTDLRGRLRGYEDTLTTLQTLPKRSNRKVFVPVAGGLAYFEGRLPASSTNEFMVLLGDNWFVRRSACETQEILNRRMTFLQQALRDAEKEQTTLDERRRFLQTECLGSPPPTTSKPPPPAGPHHAAPQAQRATPSNQRGGSGSANPTSSTLPSARAVTAASVGGSGLGGVPSATTTPTPAGHHPVQKEDESRRRPAAPVAAHADNNDDLGVDDATNTFKDEYGEYDEEGEEVEDENGFVIDPEDELTMEELCALEEQLGDEGIADEEMAEAAIKALVLAKKQRRLGAVSLALASTSTSKSQTKGTEATSPPAAAAAAATSSSSTLKAPARPPQQPPVHSHTSTTTNPATAKVVVPAGGGLVGFASTTSAAAVALPSPSSSSTPPCASTAAVRDAIVFRDPLMGGVASQPTTGAAASGPARNTMKKKSLFASESGL